MVAKIEGAQRDFSYGEVDVALKRSDDHPARKAGLRQMANSRILNSAAIQDRPGRSPLFIVPSAGTRTEKFTISAGNNFEIVFGPGALVFVNSAGVAVNAFTTQGNGAPLPWTALNLNTIVYAILDLSLYVTFPGMHPQVYTFDGVSSFSVVDYTELLIGGQKRTPFFRLSPQGIAIQPSAQLGAITVTASAPVFTAAHVGTRIRFAGRQILITGFTDNMHVSATVQESLPGSQVVAFAAGATFPFNLGDVVIGSATGSRGIVTQITPPNMVVQLISTSTSVAVSFGIAAVFAFTTADIIVGPGGGLQCTNASGINAPQPILDWDDEIINSFRGFPASCFTDQFRLGFCNFPAIPGGILWSAINSPTDAYANAASSPSNAIFEIVPGKVQVFYVVPGPESSEFVLCDERLYYIPISPTNPLKPGSVSFQLLSSDGCARVQPRVSQEIILYANAGASSVMAIVATGAYFRPFNTKDLSQFHQHLFSGITAIAVPNADGPFNERYAYVLNANGSLTVGKYDLTEIGAATPKIGWGPWSGVGNVNWVAAWNGDVHFTSSYFGTMIFEVLDDSQFLDCALPVNAAPAAFAPPGGKGPLWFIPSQSVTLIDQVTRIMGTYQIDANGFIIPQFNGGENLAIASLVAGQPWTMITEPFCPDASPGQDVGQRMKKRRISRFAAYVEHSTGFLMARLFAGPITRTSPALGTVMGTRRVPAWNIDDDATKPPPQRETTERWRPLGRAFDPRAAIIKDTPGPLLIAELGMEATI